MISRPVLLCSVVTALAVAPNVQAAPLAPVTGTLDKPGYTVIALAPTGVAKTAAAPAGTFSIVPPAALATLQLRAPDGSYAGPVVLAERDRVGPARTALRRAERRVAQTRRALVRAKRAHRGVPRARRRLASALANRARARRALAAARRDQALRPSRAILGVTAGKRLGTVTILPEGYARTAAIGRRSWAVQAAAGVPLGAGNFGLVRSAATTGAGRGDTDLDGVPGPLDVDDDGDLILDDYDRAVTPAARAAQGGRTQFSDGSHLQAVTGLGAHVSEDAVNANGGSTDEQIFAAERRLGVLEILWYGLDPDTGEIDCGTLSYCAPGGTGEFGIDSVPPGGSRDAVSPFPESFDADGDGFGSLVAGGPSPAMPVMGGRWMGIYHGATAEEIKAGDVLIEKGTVGGAPQESATTLGFVFATYPVLASYDDGQGNAASFTYPKTSAASPVRAGPSGEVIVRLSFWRPQRLRLGSEPGAGRWMDVGNLAWTLYGGGSALHPNCPQETYSAASDTLQALTTSPMPAQDSTAGGFQDVIGDRPASAANTLSFTLNLSRCLAATGQPFEPGAKTSIGITAVAGGRDGNLFFTSSWWNVTRVG